MSRPLSAVRREARSETFDKSALLHWVQDARIGSAADTDISGPEFDFVRSIRVYHVKYARQQWISSRLNEYCRRSENVDVGTYGTQGSFGWSASSVHNLPITYGSISGWSKEDCPTISQRAVFIEWRDYEGNYGFEKVNY
ncbi:hypothetical protein [Notoacmeibacter ruber]|uniref:hypothetical protein n=1 Tax=Notoacmeibacter ruber TaxID=2670375 RepID=UPI001FE08E74|nr:hypothetical protein [Notoacmeibacter ruber]